MVQARANNRGGDLRSANNPGGDRSAELTAEASGMFCRKPTAIIDRTIRLNLLMEK